MITKEALKQAIENTHGKAIAKRILKAIQAGEVCGTDRGICWCLTPDTLEIMPV